MITQLAWVMTKLRFLLLLSTLSPVIVNAHEVSPTIANLSAERGVLRFEVSANLEALLADIDLDAVIDTDEAENADDYDTLRALDPDALAMRSSELLPLWNDHPLIKAGDQSIELSVVEAQTEQEPNAELPRLTRIVLRGTLPPGAQSVVVAWPQGDGALILRQQGVEDPYTGYLALGAQTPEIDLKGGGALSGWQTFVSYIPVGFDHILPKGLDHILFVLGLFFLSTRLGPLLWQISAFTLAHTVTLALGAVGWVTVPGSIVEPLIAASIVYVAIENIFAKGLNPWRPVIVFCFGLLHGLGFASVLGEFGLPEGAFIPALIGFNIGVEFGQLTVIALAFVAVGWFARKDWYRKAIAIPASVAIAAVGAYWVVERVFL
ncbi:MAG: HupE/UreJ family protein [Paracoccaceae bacterium]